MKLPTILFILSIVVINIILMVFTITQWKTLDGIQQVMSSGIFVLEWFGGLCAWMCISDEKKRLK